MKIKYKILYNNDQCNYLDKFLNTSKINNEFYYYKKPFKENVTIDEMFGFE